MTSDEFQSLACGLGGHVVIKVILDTVRFQVGGKAIATLEWPEQGWAAIKLDSRDQTWAMALSPALSAEPGRRRNCGIVLARLVALEPDVAAELLAAAWRHGQGRLAPALRRSAFGAPRAVKAA